MSAPALTVKRLSLSELRAFPGNPRRGDLTAIARSLRAHGQYRPIVVNESTMEILAGNHLAEAARDLGWTDVDAVLVCATAEQARQIVLADNRTSDLATYDSEELAALLLQVGDLEAACYSERDLDRLLDDVGRSCLLGDEADLGPAPAEPKTRPGDIYELGEHRLVCGDAGHLAVHRGLFDGKERASLLVTDPPYGVEIEGRTKDRLKITNDSAGRLPDLLKAALAATSGSLEPGAAFYIFHPAGPLAGVFLEALAAQGWSVRQQLVWVKGRMVLGRSDFHYAHEPILYGYTPGEQPRGRGRAGWYGGNAQTSVLEFDKPVASRVHPTMKPVELLELLVRNSSRAGEIVLDPFAGSGSTLAACERLDRRAFLIELDPGYCDVIVARYEALTARTAVRRSQKVS